MSEVASHVCDRSNLMFAEEKLTLYSSAAASQDSISAESSHISACVKGLSFLLLFRLPMVHALMFSCEVQGGGEQQMELPAASSSSAVETDPPSKKSKRASAKPTKPTKPLKVPVEAQPKTAPKDKKPKGVTNGETPKPLKLDSAPAREIKPRKRAADFLSDDEDSTPKDRESVAKGSKQATTEPVKPAKKKAKEDVTPNSENDSSKHSEVKETKEPAKKPKKQTEAPVEEEDESEDEQILDLIKGFESSGDEDASEDEGFEPGQNVPQIPDSKQVKRKMKKAKKNHTDEPEEPGTVYVGRIPHGFYEHEMRAYFSQFGEIKYLRLARNRTTGRSRHHGFIQFASESVAKIVADTMNNYLMFGHILKCRVMENPHPQIWKGANRRFKKVPWNQIEKKQLEAPRTRAQWSKKIGKEESKRLAKVEKLKAIGYELDLPTLTSVDDIPVQKTLAEAEQNAIDNDTTEAPKAIEAPAKGMEKPSKQKGPKDLSTKSTKGKRSANTDDALKPEKTKESTSTSTKTKMIDSKDSQAEAKGNKKDKKPKTKTSVAVAEDIEKLPQAAGPKVKGSTATERKSKDPKVKEAKGKPEKVESGEKPKKKKKSKA
ncbi:predicted protein [Uncinocarpus reesii 1704]|uniref:RRM domain-containing protein n=1 Tax=Uncinocarpus reesii (strain UAMH 1704) TaxID=336963 RepID=C4JT36_UNCRE|nr:uncharacterized protein UREG_05625 [Uncinocarpus reesii 1704]EEP80783.1 predicted protein [Uncinocarpus reesii 1704]